MTEQQSTTEQPGTPGAGEATTPPAGNVEAPAEEQGTGQAPAQNPEQGDAEGGQDAAAESARIKQLNAESARYRTERNELKAQVEDFQAKYDRLIEGLGQLSGRTAEEQSQDPEAALKDALEERDKATAKLRQFQVETDLTSKASDAGLKTRLLIPLLKGEGKLDALNPSADDYADQVSALVAQAKADYPELRTQAVPSSSGQSPNPSNTQGHGTLTEADLTRMMDAGQHEEINKAFAEGRFKFNR